MLVITLGDPLSVTVEVLAGVLPGASPASPVALVGCAWQWRDQLARLGLAAPAAAPLAALAPGLAAGLGFVDVGTPESARPAEALTEVQRGALATRTLEALRPLAAWPRHAGPLAVVTGPIDKHACALAGYGYPGQTEFFEDLWGAPAVMILAGPRLRVALATNHVALRAVPGALTQALIERKLTLLLGALRQTFGLPRPRVAVCGLNPHAGDQGLFGDEEERCLAPALRAVRARAPDSDIVGPLPADTAFYRAYHGGFDAVLAMYHDQGLGPLKTVHFDDAVNLSGGLPHFRASPDHGPARDLFLRGLASPASFAAAVALARRHLETAR